MRVSRSVTLEDEVADLGTVCVTIQEIGQRASLALTCDGSPMTLRTDGPSAHAVVELAVTAIRVAAVQRVQLMKEGS